MHAHFDLGAGFLVVCLILVVLFVILDRKG